MISPGTNFPIQIIPMDKADRQNKKVSPKEGL